MWIYQREKNKCTIYLEPKHTLSHTISSYYIHINVATDYVEPNARCKLLWWQIAIGLLIFGISFLHLRFVRWIVSNWHVIQGMWDSEICFDFCFCYFFPFFSILVQLWLCRVYKRHYKHACFRFNVLSPEKYNKKSIIFLVEWLWKLVRNK